MAMNAPVFPRPIAHRGLHNRNSGIIENSRSAFEAAVERGFAIECDLQLSADDEPVLFHDQFTERLTGLPGRIRDMTAAEITKTPLLDSTTGDCPQRLTDFLEQINGRVLLQIELKRQDDEAETRTLAKATAEALGSYAGPVTVESFDPDLIRLIREFGFSGPRGIITYDYEQHDPHGPTLSDGQRFILRNLLHWSESRFDFISCAKDALDLPAMVFWRALGVPVTAWTVRSAAEAAAASAGSGQIVFEGFDPEPA